jgi:transcriptional regulator with XRE-family HTH domain
MASPRGKKEASRAQALGALVRRLRRDRKETLGELAERIPMSASNLSRLELGNQGPPADEAIERIAAALEADASELLRAAGRTAGGKSFEERVLERLDALSEEMRQVKDAVEGKRLRP